MHTRQYTCRIDRFGLWLITTFIVISALVWATLNILLPHRTSFLSLNSRHKGNVDQLIYLSQELLVSAGGHWGTNTGGISFWNTRDGRMADLFEDYDIHSIAFAPNDYLMASGAMLWSDGSQAKSGAITIWNMRKRRKVRAWITNGYPITAIAFLPDNKTLLTCGRDATLKYWDVKTAKLLRTVNTGLGFALLSVISKDGNVVSLIDGSDVMLYSTNSGKLNHRLSGHSNRIVTLAFSPQDQMLATGSLDRTICIWNVSTGARQHSLNTHNGTPATAVAFSPDSKTLASGHIGMVIRLWDVQTGRLLRTIGTRKPNGRILSLSFSPDGKNLAVSEGGQIKVWDIGS